MREEQEGGGEAHQLFAYVLIGLGRWLLGIIKGEDEKGLILDAAREILLQQVGDDEIFNLEVKGGIVDVRGVRILEYRLEANAEFANGIRFLAGVSYRGDGVDVSVFGLH